MSNLQINKTERNKFVSLIAILIIFITLGIILTNYIQDTPLENIKNWSDNNLEKSVILYIIVFSLITIFAIPTWPFAVMSGILFDFKIAFIITMVGAIIGATGAFSLSRYLGKGFVDKLIQNKHEKIEKYNRLIQENAFLTIILLRAIPIFPSNIVNYALGLTNVKTSIYFIATLIGFIPAQVIFILSGKTAYSFNLNYVLIIIAIMVSMLFLLKIYKKLNHSS